MKLPASPLFLFVLTLPFLISCATEEPPESSCESCDIGELDELTVREVSLVRCRIMGTFLRCEPIEIRSPIRPESSFGEMELYVKVSTSPVTASPEQRIGGDGVNFPLEELDWNPGSELQVTLRGKLVVPSSEYSPKGRELEFEETHSLSCEDPAKCPSAAQAIQGVALAAPFVVWQLGFASEEESVPVTIEIPTSASSKAIVFAEDLSLERINVVHIPVFAEAGLPSIIINKKAVKLGSPGYYILTKKGARPMNDDDRKF